MLRLLIMAISLIFLAGLANAQNGIDHGPTGTLNLDYFNGAKDPHITWLVKDQDHYHTKPLIGAFGEGDLRRVKVELEWILARFINHPQALFIAAAYSIRTKNPTWAVPHFQRALSIYPQYALTHAQYGKYLTDIGAIDQGIEQLKKAAEMDPNLVAVHVWLAAAYAKSGNADRAREAAEKARSLGHKGEIPK